MILTNNTGFFLTSSPNPSGLYIGTYNATWVSVSVLLAIIAAYAGLNTAARIQYVDKPWHKLAWSIISSLTLGVGIWSMHFIGMLALNLPCSISYDLTLTLISMLPAVLASGIALGVWNIGNRPLSPLPGSLLLGSGIALMHYTGMAAMRLDGHISYSPGLFTLSLFVAIALSYLALRLKDNRIFFDTKNIAISAIIGSAIAGMHYTAMYAAYFFRGDKINLDSAAILYAEDLDVVIVLTSLLLALGTVFIATVSKYKQLEKQVLSSENRIKIAATSSQIGIWEHDLITHKVLWDSSMYSLYHRQIDDFPGTYQAWLALLHPDDKMLAIKSLRNAIDGDEEYWHEFRVILPDGSVRHIKGSAKLIKDQAGNPVKLIGTDWDNNEERVTQRRLKFANTAINKSQNVFFWVNDKGSVVDINDYACQSLLYRHEEIIGHNIWSIDVGLGSTEETWPEKWQWLKDHKNCRFETIYQRKDGSTFPVDVSTSFLQVDEEEYCFLHGHNLTKRKANEEKISQLAYYDPLTQLPNRRLMQERLLHSIEKAKRDNLTMAVLVFDLNRFKAVNDSYGHATGDELLQEVGKRLSANMRKSDTLARVGGDEFVVLLEDIGVSEKAAQVGNKIISVLCEPFTLSQAVEVQVGVSIGIALYPEHGDKSDILLNRADSALYRAKQQEEASFVYYSEEITQSARNRIALEKRLRKAISQNELRVFYQPQVNIATGEIIGAEALVRWQCPDEGLIPPFRFIPVAEESHLIIDIGEWVLHETCRQGQQWLGMGLPALTLAVNVSPQQFRRSNIDALVASTLASTGFPANHLELEITESGLMTNKENARNILNSLHEQNIRIAIDDFGTGYSSLSHLKHFPLDVLKIDKSFIDEIPHNKDDIEITTTIIAMGRILGMTLVAEGVETTEQLDFLEKAGCDAYQGYLKSRPVPAHDFVTLLQT